MITQYINKYSELKSKNIVVIGDYCIDRYLTCSNVTEKHDYSELLTAEVYESRCFPGGAGNVALNLLSLGINVYCIGVVGDDGDGYDLLRSLKEYGANVDYIFMENERKTVSCIRPVLNGNLDINIHEFICYNKHKISTSVIEKVKLALLNLMETIDAIVIIEQFEKKGFGILSTKIKDFLGSLASKYPSKIVLADSRDYISDYTHVIVKCNQYEYSQLNDDSFIKQNKVFFLTKGEKGISVINHDMNTIEDVPPPVVLDNIYTCGAGDSATAGIVVGLLLGLDYIDAARLGNVVASITIEKLNSTGVATTAEVINRLTGICI